jgi:hypothetical protein
MDVLKPLTISNSTRNSPTKLLTEDRKTYLLYKPINEHTFLQDNLLKFILSHFKVRCFNTAVFNYKNKQIFCLEQRPNSFVFSSFYHYLWRDKKSYNQFLNPEELLKINFINLLFPIFNAPVGVSILNDKKLVLTGTFDSMTFDDFIQFEPKNIQQTILNEPEVKKFVSYRKREMNELLEAYEILHHEKLMTDLKYKVSMNSTLRNAYWDELKNCFDSSYKSYVFSSVKDYLIRI